MQRAGHVESHVQHCSHKQHSMFHPAKAESWLSSQTMAGGGHDQAELRGPTAGWAKPLGINASCSTSPLRHLLPLHTQQHSPSCLVIELVGLALDGRPQAFVVTTRSISQGQQLSLGRLAALPPPAAAPAKSDSRGKQVCSPGLGLCALRHRLGDVWDAAS